MVPIFRHFALAATAIIVASAAAQALERYDSLRAQIAGGRHAS